LKQWRIERWAKSAAAGFVQKAGTTIVDIVHSWPLLINPAAEIDIYFSLRISPRCFGMGAE
jgi:hypothetical protein